VGVNLVHLTDEAIVDPRLRGRPLRVEAVHEGLHDLHVGVLRGGVEEGLHLGGGSGDGFLDEDVLAGLDGAHAPGDVELVGEGNVDGFDVGGGEELLVRTECHGDVQRLAGRAGARLVA